MIDYEFYKKKFGTRMAVDAMVRAIQLENALLCAGSGLTKQTNEAFSTWEELVTSLIELSKSVGAAPSQRLVHTEELAKKKSLLDAIDSCKRMIPPAKLIEHMRSCFVHKANDYKVHEILSELPFLAYITTNFDQVIEEFLWKGGVDTPIYTQEDIQSLGLIMQEPRVAESGPKNEHVRHRIAPRFLLKAHGDIGRPQTWILTSEDYRRIVHRNPAYRFLMRALLSRYSFVFIGFGLNDPDFELLLQEVSVIFLGEMPDHFLLVKADDFNSVADELLYRRHRVRLIPYGKKFQSLRKFLDNEVSQRIKNPRPPLRSSSSLKAILEFIQDNENFEDPLHRDGVTGHAKTIVKTLVQELANPGLTTEEFRDAISIERIATHHFYLKPEKPYRKLLADAIFNKAKELHRNGRITDFLEQLEEEAWQLYLVAIESIGFSLVRHRPGTTKKVNEVSDSLRDLIKTIEVDFGLKPSDEASDTPELYAACYYHRVQALRRVNIESCKYSDPEWMSELDRALRISKKAGWESLESAILQDMIRPAPDPAADEKVVEYFRRNVTKKEVAVAKLLESIELARYKGMHRRVVGGVIALSKLQQGEERIQQLKYATEYYRVHGVHQPPLIATATAEEWFARHDIVGVLTEGEKSRIRSWMDTQRENIQEFYVKGLKEIV